MRLRGKLNFVAVLVLAAASASAQSAPAAPTPAQGQSGSPTQNSTQAPGGYVPQDAGQDVPVENQPANTGDEQRATVPLSLDMSSSGLEVAQEATRTNYLDGGLDFALSHDSNLLSTPNPIGGFTYSVLPNIALSVGRKRLAWKASYAGGYVINQKLTAYNQTTHNATFDLSYRLTRHVTLSLHDQFSRIPNLVDQLPLNSAVSGSGGIEQPNRSVINPLTLEQDNLGSGQITYQYSASDMVGVGATSYISRFGAPPAGTTTALFDTTRYGANAFYNHRLTTRHWIGLTYSYQRLSSMPGNELVDSHSILALYTIHLTSRMQVALFAGPEYSSLSAQIVTTSGTPPVTTSVPTASQRWSANVGGNFSWQGARTSVNASVSRSVSDGAGLTGAVALISGSGGVLRQINRFASIQLSGSYGRSTSLDQAISNFNSINSAAATAAWNQQITRGFSANFGYTRQYQKESSPLAPTLVINHSRGWVTIGYNFHRSLGR